MNVRPGDATASLVAQVAHGDPQDLRLLAVGGSPDATQQLRVAPQDPGMAGQRDQQPELRRGQVDLGRLAHDAMRRGLDQQAGMLDGIVRGRPPARRTRRRAAATLATSSAIRTGLVR